MIDNPETKTMLEAIKRHCYELDSLIDSLPEDQCSLQINNALDHLLAALSATRTSIPYEVEPL